MPKKKKLTEPEVRALIRRDARYRLGCEDFEPAFTLHRVEPDPKRWPSANWDVQSVQNADTWKPVCAEAFREAVTHTRGKFDIDW